MNSEFLTKDSIYGKQFISHNLMIWNIHLTFTILGCGQHHLYEDFSEKGFNQKGGKVKREN